MFVKNCIRRTDTKTANHKIVTIMLVIGWKEKRKKYEYSLCINAKKKTQISYYMSRMLKLAGLAVRELS